MTDTTASTSPSSVPRTRAAAPWRSAVGWLSVAAFAGLLVPALGDALAFDRQAVASGQWWRWLTAHLAHYNTDHFLWDIFAFVTVGLLCELRDRRRTVICLAAAAPIITVAVVLTSPLMQSYRGLSGLDSALFAMLATLLVRDGIAQRRPGLTVAAALLLAAFVGKSAFEWSTGATLFVDSATAGFVPLALAHVVGGSVGIIVALAGPLSDNRDTAGVTP